MKYEIVYISKNGNTEQIAHALAKTLPAGSYRLINMDQEKPSEDAETYLIGFGVYKGTCPYRLLEWMETLEGKKIMLFATGGLAAFQNYQHRLEMSIGCFLPENCEFLGLFLCQGKITQEGYAYLESCLSEPGDSKAVSNLQQLYAYSQSHPDQQDLQNARTFLENVLQ